MMAAEEQTTTPLTTKWTYRSGANRRRAVDALLRDPLWSLLDDEAIASIAEASPGVVRDPRRTIGSAAPLSTSREGDLP
jgi:hypothetical protein